MNRRSFLLSASGAAAHPLLNSVLPAQSALAYAAQPSPARTGASKSLHAADYSLIIKPHTIEISPGIQIKTVAYNDQIPGPMLRLRRGVPVTIDVTNETTIEEIVHWHGLAIDSLNDGAMEEGSPMIPAGGHLRYSFTPNPSGSRWYHTHIMAGSNLDIGAYSGLYGFLLIDGAPDPGHYDQEVFLTVHHWQPTNTNMKEMEQVLTSTHARMEGWHVVYKYATINQHRLGAGEPLRVKRGQKVLMRLLNASATENIELALPGHTFKVIAMDGNPVPNPREVEVLSVAVAERVDAIVEMKSPGVWILGSTDEEGRQMGLGIVVEYAGKTGKPVWIDPQEAPWDYVQFASRRPAPAPDKTFTMALVHMPPRKGSKFATWAINGIPFPDIEPIRVKEGKRYRVVFQNASTEGHPMHLHRHTFEVTSIGDRQISGLMKDVVNVAPLGSVAVDFVADNPGDTLIHCHMAQHMDFGMAQLIKYES